MPFAIGQIVVHKTNTSIPMVVQEIISPTTNIFIRDACSQDGCGDGDYACSWIDRNKKAIGYFREHELTTPPPSIIVAEAEF